MQALPLKATEREVLGKKVKKLRQQGVIPGHVFGKGLETEHVAVPLKEFLKVFDQAGETGLIDLKIGEEKTRPVLVRGVQYDPVHQSPLHIDFYQVNLKVKVTVPVPVILEGDEPELVHSGEAVVIQPINEVEVEALPTELPENLTVNIDSLKVIGDAIHVSQISVPEGVTILADPESVVVKLDTAITEEMQKLMEEQAAEQAAAAAEATTEGDAEGEQGEEEGGEQTEDQNGTSSTEEGGVTEEQAKETQEDKKSE